jgi:lysine 6-dehydrogenase
VSVVPDTGLAPGMVNVLAQMGIDRLDETRSVRIYVGGLPQHPTGPLKYQIVYSLEGVLDYYTTRSWVLREGRPTQVAALSEREDVEFPAPVGTLEAFHTAGGLSTMAQRYAGKIPTMEYKTLRYPGHAHIMEAIRELGLLELEPVDVKGMKVVPRDVALAAMGPRLRRTKSPDLVALRVVVEGTKDGRPARHSFELVDRADERGLSAMMRTTGFSLSITGQLQAGGEIAPGVHTPDECVPGERYVSELRKRGVVIEERAE